MLKKKNQKVGLSWRKGEGEIKKCSDIKTTILYYLIILLICSPNSNLKRKQFTQLRLVHLKNTEATTLPLFPAG